MCRGVLRVCLQRLGGQRADLGPLIEWQAAAAVAHCDVIPAQLEQRRSIEGIDGYSLFQVLTPPFQLLVPQAMNVKHTPQVETMGLQVFGIALDERCARFYAQLDLQLGHDGLRDFILYLENVEYFTVVAFRPKLGFAGNVD